LPEKQIPLPLGNQFQSLKDEFDRTLPEEVLAAYRGLLNAFCKRSREAIAEFNEAFGARA
jgi:hypothetical protein